VVTENHHCSTHKVEILLINFPHLLHCSASNPSACDRWYPSHLRRRCWVWDSRAFGGGEKKATLVIDAELGPNRQQRRHGTAGDLFSAWPFPVPALNPAKAGHLYVAYADTGDNSGDKADIFLVASTNSGTNWTSPLRVNTVWTNDQWMPVLAVKPDGTKLFMAWYDRRRDPNNGLMEVYGRWGTISTNGTVTLDDEFRITPVNFPQVFSGTDTNNFIAGQYDPVYPPDFVNLHWWYPEWPDDPLDLAVGIHKNHVGEYNGAAGDANHVYFSWTDNRVRVHQSQTRAQSDIRLLRLPWP